MYKTRAGWLYALSKSDKLTITCPQGIETIILEAGSGRLHNNESCGLTSSTFVLPSGAKITGTPIVTNLSIITPFVLNLTVGEQEGIKILNNTPLLLEVMHIANDRLPLTI